MNGVSIRDRYKYNEETDRYERVYKVEPVEEKENVLNDTVEYLSFSTTDEGLTMLNDVILLCDMFNDEYYHGIKNKIVEKLKEINK